MRGTCLSSRVRVPLASRRSLAAALAVVRLALCWGSVAAMAGWTAAAAQERADGWPVLHVGHVEMAPLSFTGPAGVMRGFSVELIAAIADRAGYRVAFVPFGSPEAALGALARGEIDVSPLLAVSPGRAGSVAFTTPVAPLRLSLMVRSDDERFASEADLEGRRIGVRTGTIAAEVAGRVSAAGVVPYETSSAMATALLQGEVDALVASAATMRRMARRAGIPDRFRVVGPPLAEASLAYALSPDAPDLQLLFDAAILDLRSSGELQRMHGIWFARPSSFWANGRGAWGVAAAGWVAAMLSAVAAIVATGRARQRARKDITRVTAARDRLALAHAHLARTNERLEQANEQLERFTNVAAHDLRAPLRALMTLPGWMREELTEGGVTLSGEVSGLLDDMSDQAASLDRMLKELLDYARLGGEAERTRFSPAERIANLARTAGMPDEFTLDIARDLPDLELNVVEFDTVMRNLLSNAVKHHDRPNGRIVVRGRRQGPVAILEIEDDGPGIAPEHRERVFEIFSTLGGRDKAGGGGMGLAFVRRIVGCWGGAVTAGAPRRGRGTVFRLSVPAPAGLSKAA